MTTATFTLKALDVDPLKAAQYMRVVGFLQARGPRSRRGGPIRTFPSTDTFREWEVVDRWHKSRGWSRGGFGIEFHVDAAGQEFEVVDEEIRAAGVCR